MTTLAEYLRACRQHWPVTLGLVLIPIGSTVVAMLLHRPHLAYLVSLLIAFFVVLCLVAAISTGRIEGNWGVSIRRFASTWFWVQIVILVVGYIFITLWPIAYAIQEKAAGR